MIEHTPEPWATEERGIIYSLHPAWRKLWAIDLGDCGRHYTREQDEANARRVVACVNACVGSSTDWLRGYGDMLNVTKAGKPLLENIAALRQQRDEYEKKLLTITKQYEKAVEVLKQIAGNSYVEEFSPPAAKQCLEELGETKQ